MNVSGRVAGKVAFITGAARGQGRSHALRLAEEGADVILVDRCAQLDSVPYEMPEPDDLKETARLVEKLGRRAVAAAVDVRDRAALDGAVAAGVRKLGRLDIVCANAGIYNTADAISMDPVTWQEMIDINLTGVWNTCRAALPHIRAAHRGGAITITSSCAGLKGFAGVSHYVTTKHAVVGLTKALAAELAGENIRVNSVHPTNVDTDMIQNDATYRRFRPDLDNPTRDDFEKASADVLLLPASWVESIDISNAVLFLSSDEARFVTGVTLPVDGGTLLR